MSGVVLSQAARTGLNQYRQQIARLNNVESTAERFAVQPAPLQRMIDGYQQSADFLQQVNIVPVSQAAGEKLGLGVGQSIASTTNTKIQPRRPTILGDVEGVDEYLCTQTNYDVAYLWELLNAWAHLPDFQQRLRNMVLKAIALDKLKIGFNGVMRRPTSDKLTYPLLQDVNKGWLQKIRENAPERVFSGEPDGQGVKHLKIGAAEEFKTIDALVETAIEDLIAEQYRDAGLVVICGRGILTDKYLPLMNQVLQPTEQIAARTIYANKQLGTLPAIHVPHFPANTMLITRPDNLSIYLQDGTARRLIKDEPEWDRTTDYQSINEAYVVEDYGMAALIENVEYAP